MDSPRRPNNSCETPKVSAADVCGQWHSALKLPFVLKVNMRVDSPALSLFYRFLKRVAYLAGEQVSDRTSGDPEVLPEPLMPPAYCRNATVT